MIALVLLVAIILLVTFIRRILRRSGKKAEDAATVAATPGRPASDRSRRQDQVVGDAFDESHLHRRREVIDRTQPEHLRGRVHELHAWDKKRAFGRDKVIAFHLDYDRSRTDFGDLLVKLTKRYFKSLRLEDGDDVQLVLEWKRKKGKSRAIVAEFYNMTSGQRIEPSTLSVKAGLVEPV